MITHELKFEQSHLTEKDGGHFYATPSGNTYPSATTILGATNPEKDRVLENWRKKVGYDVAQYITDESAIIGTQVHEQIEHYLNGTWLPYQPRLISKAHFQNLMPLIKNISGLYGNEIRLYSDSLKLGGTADCIAFYKGVLSIIDYKTKRRFYKKEWLYDHFLQLTAYAFMFSFLQGVKVERIVLLITNELGGKQEFIEDPRNFIRPLFKRVREYYEQAA